MDRAILYLADGRVFVRLDDGLVREADTAERSYCVSVLNSEPSVTVDPIHGVILSPPAES